MSTKSIDEIAANLTIATLEHNSKLQRGTGSSVSVPENAESVGKMFFKFKQILLGEINPLVDYDNKE